MDASSVEGSVNISTQALAAEAFDAMNTGQLEKIRDLVSDDFVDHGFPARMPPGPDGYIAILTFVTTVLQIRYEVHDVISDGDTVAIRAPHMASTRWRLRASSRRASLRDEDRSLLPLPRRPGCASTGASATSLTRSIRSAR